MAEDETLNRARMLERAARIRPTKSLSRRKRNEKRGKKVMKMKDDLIADKESIKARKNLERGTAIAAAPREGLKPIVPQGAAEPGSSYKRVGNSFFGRGTTKSPGAPGVTGFATAAEQLKRVRAMNEAGEQRPETLAPAERGFQYQPSQWAQQTALRNARVGFNATANKYRDQRGLDAAETQLDAEFQGNPALQGLERSKMFQNNVTLDQKQAIDQRGQDVRSFDAGRRNQSAERLAGARDASVAQTAAARNQFESGKYALERGDTLRQQRFENDQKLSERGRQNFQDTQGIIERMAVNEDGEPDTAKAQGLNQIMANSGALNLPPADAQQALMFFNQFAESAQAAGDIQESPWPVLSKVFSFLEADVGPPQSIQEVYERMQQVKSSQTLQQRIGLKDNQIKTIEAFKFQ